MNLPCILILIFGLADAVLSQDPAPPAPPAPPATDNSCADRCRDGYDPRRPCQCNTRCSEFNNCCSDYTTVCPAPTDNSCADRCRDGYDPRRPCQCNTRCSEFNNCCSDYTTVCPAQTSSGCTTTMRELTRQLWVKDAQYRLDTTELTFDPQGLVTGQSVVDLAPDRFFTYINTTKLDLPIYSTFLALLDNYNPTKAQPEVESGEENREEEAFLDALLDTDTMDALYDYLVCQGEVQDRPQFRSTMRHIWFDLYPRSSSSSVSDSSGFEHIMVGDYKSGTKVGGMHSWVTFYERERVGDFDYYGWRGEVMSDAVKLTFTWAGRVKAVTSMFLRVSPAFDIAIYTACYLMHPDSRCGVEVGPHNYYVQTYDINGHISTAFVML